MRQDIIKLFIALLLVEISLVFVYWLDLRLGYPSEILHYLFDLNGEANIPTWFSSIQLFTIGIVFFLTARSIPVHGIENRRFTTALALIFTGLSLDETAIIHERLNDSLAKFRFLLRFNDLNDGIWIPIYLLLIALVFLYLCRHFRIVFQTDRAACLLIMGGVGVFILGAIGMEIFDDVYLLKVQKSTLYHLESMAEEFCEMFGATLILCGALLLYRPNKRQSSIS